MGFEVAAAVVIDSVATDAAVEAAAAVATDALASAGADALAGATVDAVAGDVAGDALAGDVLGDALGDTGLDLSTSAATDTGLDFGSLSSQSVSPLSDGQVTALQAPTDGATSLSGAGAPAATPEVGAAANPSLTTNTATGIDPALSQPQGIGSPAPTTGDPALSQPQGMGGPNVTGDPALNQPVGVGGGNIASSPPINDTPGIFDKSGWAERNAGVLGLAGNAVGGVGKGVAGMMATNTQTAAALNRQTQEQGYIAGNYAGRGLGLMNAGSPVTIGAGNPTPSARFTPKSYMGGSAGQYVYDPAQKKLVWQAAA